MDPSSQAASVEPVVLARNQLLLIVALFPLAFVIIGLVLGHATGDCARAAGHPGARATR